MPRLLKLCRKFIHENALEGITLAIIINNTNRKKIIFRSFQVTPTPWVHRNMTASSTADSGALVSGMMSSLMIVCQSFTETRFTPPTLTQTPTRCGWPFWRKLLQGEHCQTERKSKVLSMITNWEKKLSSFNKFSKISLLEHSS